MTGSHSSQFEFPLARQPRLPFPQAKSLPVLPSARLKSFPAATYLGSISAVLRRL